MAAPASGCYHVAVATETDAIPIYVSGDLATTINATGMAQRVLPIQTGGLFAKSNPQGPADAGAVQELSLWSQCLAAHEIKPCMKVSVPGPEYGSQTLYQSSCDLKNSVTGTSATVINARLVKHVGIESGFTPLKIATSPGTTGPMLLDQQALRRVAEKCADQLPRVLDRASLPAHLTPKRDRYKNVLAAMPDAQAADLRQFFIRKLHLGHARAQANHPASSIKVVGDGHQTVLDYHTEDGQRHEVWRSDATFTAVQSAVLDVVDDSIGVLFAILGVVAAAIDPARDIASWFDPLTDKFIAAISGKTGVTIVVLQTVLKIVATLLNLAGNNFENAALFVQCLAFPAISRPFRIAPRT